MNEADQKPQERWENVSHNPKIRRRRLSEFDRHRSVAPDATTFQAVRHPGSASSPPLNPIVPHPDAVSTSRNRGLDFWSTLLCFSLFPWSAGRKKISLSHRVRSGGYRWSRVPTNLPEPRCRISAPSRIPTCGITRDPVSSTPRVSSSDRLERVQSLQLYISKVKLTMRMGTNPYLASDQTRRRCLT